MIQKVFAVWDSKALAFMQPFFSNSTGAAVRAFADVANEDRSPIAKHPGDYQLYEIGTFNDLDGIMNSLVPNKLLGCALDFVEVKKSNSPVLDKFVRESIDKPAVEVGNGS